jgi:transcriptional regulator with XRE-family HTH domain
VKRKPARRRLDGPIHARIAKLREQRELTQGQLAEAVGVDKTAVSHWENGVSRPDITRLAKLASVLDVSVDDLIAGEKAA